MALFLFDAQPPNYLRFNIPDAVRKDRYAFMKTAGDAIVFLFQTIRYLFHANRTDKVWVTYSDFVDEIVLDGLTSVVANNLEFVLQHLTYDPTSPPFLKVVLTLKDNSGLAFIPEVSSEPLSNTLLGELTNVVDEVFNIGSFVLRLSEQHREGTFLTPLKEVKELQAMKAEILRRAAALTPRLLAFKENYQKYRFIWEMDKRQQIQTFQIRNSASVGPDQAKMGELGIPALINVAKIQDEVFPTSY